MPEDDKLKFVGHEKNRQPRGCPMRWGPASEGESAGGLPTEIGRPCYNVSRRPKEKPVAREERDGFSLFGLDLLRELREKQQ